MRCFVVISMVLRGKVDASVLANLHPHFADETSCKTTWTRVKIVFFRQGRRGKYNISILETLGMVEMT